MQISIQESRKLDALGLSISTIQRALRESHLYLLSIAQRDYDWEKVHHTECSYDCCTHRCTLDELQDELHRAHNVIEYNHVCYLLDVDPTEWICRALDVAANLPSMRWADIRPVY